MTAALALSPHLAICRHRALSGSSSAPVVSLTKVNAVVPGKSSGEIPAARPCDPWAFYRTFRDQWPAFLKAHFRNSAHIAAFFQVDDKTARDWLGGVSQPRGPVVAYAVATMPAETAAMVGVTA
jgi:hypothetical protein